MHGEDAVECLSQSVGRIVEECYDLMNDLRCV